MTKKIRILIYPLLVMGLLLAVSCRDDNNDDNNGNNNNNNNNDATTFTDSRDGNVYKTVKIGNQVWMAENLRYLPSVVPAATSSTTDPYCYIYMYNGTDVSEAKATSNYTTYGVLYNWQAAKTASPAGWHLPSDAEWKELEKFLGMTEEQANAYNWRRKNEGGKLKETRTTHWTTPNEGATNESGFTALPGGLRNNQDRLLWNIRIAGYWWTATDQSDKAYYRSLVHYDSTIFRGYDDKSHAYSVRCIKD